MRACVRKLAHDIEYRGGDGRERDGEKGRRKEDHLAVVPTFLRFALARAAASTSFNPIEESPFFKLLSFTASFSLSLSLVCYLYRLEARGGMHDMRVLALNRPYVGECIGGERIGGQVKTKKNAG